MPIYAISKKYFRVVDINLYISDFDKSMGQHTIAPRAEYLRGDLMAHCNEAATEWLVFDSLNDAQTALIMLLRLVNKENPQLVDPSVETYASPLIFEFPIEPDQKFELQSLDAETLAKYPDYRYIPHYLYESLESELIYTHHVVHAFSISSKVKLPRFRLHAINSQEPTNVYLIDACGENKTLSLSQQLVEAPKRKRLSMS